MAVSIPEKCLKELDEFFAKKTVHDVNRDAYLVCNLQDFTNKVTISLIFLRDWDSVESDSFNQVIIEGKGVVFQFPCYWVSVPKELTIGFITYIIDTFYDQYVSKWVGNNSSNGNAGNQNPGFIGGNGNCGCNNSNAGFINPYTPPPCNLI